MKKHAWALAALLLFPCGASALVATVPPPGLWFSEWQKLQGPDGKVLYVRAEEYKTAARGTAPSRILRGYELELKQSRVPSVAAVALGGIWETVATPTKEYAVTLAARDHSPVWMAIPRDGGPAVEVSPSGGGDKLTLLRMEPPKPSAAPAPSGPVKVPALPAAAKGTQAPKLLPAKAPAPQEAPAPQKTPAPQKASASTPTRATTLEEAVGLLYDPKTQPRAQELLIGWLREQETREPGAIQRFIEETVAARPQDLSSRRAAWEITLRGICSPAIAGAAGGNAALDQARTIGAGGDGAGRQDPWEMRPAHAAPLSLESPRAKGHGRGGASDACKAWRQEAKIVEAKAAPSVQTPRKAAPPAVVPAPRAQQSGEEKPRSKPGAKDASKAAWAPVLIGAAVGAAVGMALGPLGAVAGAIIGGVIGWLISKAPGAPAGPARREENPQAP